MDHHGSLALAIAGDVLEIETFGQVEVELDGRQLPRPADGVLDVDVDLRAIERAAALVGDVVEPAAIKRSSKTFGGLVPQLILTHRLLGRASRELRLEILEAERPQHREHEIKQRHQLALDVLARGEDMAVVLGEATTAHQAVHGTRQLVAVDGAKLEQAHRQLAIAALVRLVDHHVERAVHRLRVVRRAIHLHGRVHAVGVEVEVA